MNYDSFSPDGYTGDVYLLVKLLLPTAGKKRVYNLQSKQIVKLLSQVCTTKIVLSNCELICTHTMKIGIISFCAGVQVQRGRYGRRS